MGEKAWKIGRHELQIEPPDIVFVRMVGDVTESETIGTPNTIRSMFCRTASAVLVGRRPRAWAHPSRARRQAGNWPLSTKQWGTVAFGVGFTQRLFARLLLGAAKVLRGEVETVVLLSHEEEARTWISQERLRRQAATST